MKTLFQFLMLLMKFPKCTSTSYKTAIISYTVSAKITQIINLIIYQNNQYFLKRIRNSKYSHSIRFKFTPNCANGPSYRSTCATRHLSLLARVSGVLYPPLIPTPSARICSSSGVAPPVINVRINVRALSLK